MKQIRIIAAKEYKDYFISPIAYIVISMFLIITGWFFFSTFFIFDRADLRDFFSLLPIIFSFIIPAITMRLFSEEQNIGSYEILLTMPVSFSDIDRVVAHKYSIVPAVRRHFPASPSVFDHPGPRERRIVQQKSASPAGR